MDSPQLSVNLNVQIDRTAPVYTLLTLAILHGLSQSLPVVQCEKRLEKVAYVSVAMVAWKDDSLQAGNTVSYKSVAGVSMHERIEVDIQLFQFRGGREAGTIST